MGWAIALHGGAGDIPYSLPPERRQPREEALLHCLQIGVKALKSNTPPLEVVELVVCIHYILSVMQKSSLSVFDYYKIVVVGS